MEDTVKERPSCSLTFSTSDPAESGSSTLARNYQLESLKEGNSWKQCLLHKEHVVTLLFFIVMSVSLILNELLYSDSTGITRGGHEIRFMNTTCSHDMAGCFVTNILLAVGLFGFFGGITNWIAMELFFVKVPLIYGSGVVGKHYLMIRETFKRIVVEVLFNPTALDEYLQDERNNMNKLLNIESMSGSIFSDTLVSNAVTKEFEKISSSPEGLQLSIMGVDMNEFNRMMMMYIRELLLDVKPLILAQMDRSQLLDAVGMQEQVELIVQNNLQDMKQDHVRQVAPYCVCNLYTHDL